MAVVFPMQYVGILLAQGAVLDEMAVAAILEASFPFDHIDVTI